VARLIPSSMTLNRFGAPMDSITPGRPLDCAAALRSLWEYLDRRASVEQDRAIYEHLALCDGCRANFEFEERLVKSISALRAQHSHPARLRERVLAALRAEGLDGEHWT
jgi:anti-sigma factor (TIGR02949 family)